MRVFSPGSILEPLLFNDIIDTVSCLSKKAKFFNELMIKPCMTVVKIYQIFHRIQRLI